MITTSWDLRSYFPDFEIWSTEYNYDKCSEDIDDNFFIKIYVVKMLTLNFNLKYIALT